MSNVNNCILQSPCNLTGSDACTRMCPSFIAIHGYSGTGGRNGNANLPNDYRLLTLATSPVRGEQSEAYKLIDAYVKTFSRAFADGNQRIKSLYLYSAEPGTGKTTSACAVLNEYIMRTYIGMRSKGETPPQRPVYFLDCNRWQTDYNSFTRNGIPKDIAEVASERYYRTMEIAKVVPFMVCDDIAVRSASEAFRADLHTVINERVTNGLPTVYTSNIAMDELDTVFDRRLADRIRDMCVTVNFVGNSKRGMRK